MRGMTKPVCIKIENMIKTELTKVLGEPKLWLINDFEWVMPYGETGTITFHLICDSAEIGHSYRSSWLAGCLDDRSKHVDADGYTKPRDQIEGGWPFPFTYPSGKYNLHFDNNDMAANRRDLATYLYAISPQGSREKHEFGKIEFETVD